MLIDVNGTIWIGTSGGGLNRLNANDETFTGYIPERSNLKGINNPYVISLHNSCKQYLWVGTYSGGLNRMNIDTESFEHFTESNGLINNIVCGICKDDSSNLWLSTNNGLVRFNTETFHSRNLNVSDGIQGLNFRTGSYHKGRSGKMYFGGTNGLTIFHPKEVLDDSITLSPTIVQFNLFKQTVNVGDSSILSKPIFLTDTIKLSYSQNDIGFEFNSMVFVSPHKNRYRYRLEGFDNDWNESGNLQRATYTNISPGDYSFRIQAAIGDGKWTEGQKIHIIVVPPFWQTLWFRLIMAMVGIGIILLIINLREKRLIRLKKILEERVRIRTKEILQQKEEIKSQRDELEEQRNYGLEKNKEIENQRNVLLDLNGELHMMNEEVLAQKEELERTQKHLVQSEKMASIGVLTAGIAHEINNPINFVYAGANCIKRDFSDIDRVLKLISSIEDAGEEPLEIIQKLLDAKNQCDFK